MKFYFPNETKVKARTPYVYRYTICGKVKKEGFASGKTMSNMVQFKHHNVSQDKLFEFRPLFVN